ncbi:MAG: flagellar basal body rod protein FlgC [Pseudomonadales bacterium]
MALLNVFDVAGSAMAAQSVRLNTTASNIANAQSVAANPDETYRARHPVFAQQLATQQQLMGQSGAAAQNGGAGVQVLGIVESQAPLEMRYEPDHPYANEDGYVAYPNVSVVEEMANMISASRSFQLNVEVLNTAKTLAERVLNLGQ